MEYRKKSPIKYDSNVEKIQRLINDARRKAVLMLLDEKAMPTMLRNSHSAFCTPHRPAIRGNWVYIKQDGYFGDKTENAVKGLQNFLREPEDGVFRDKTFTTLQKFLSLKEKNHTRINNNIKSIYGFAQDATNKINIPVNVDSTSDDLQKILKAWNTALISVKDGLSRRINKNFPVNKTMRIRNITRELERCQKFIERACRYGFKSALPELGENLTKENAIKYLREIIDVVESSSLFKVLKVSTKILEIIKKIVGPVVNVLKKIPGLKYASVIDKLVRATYRMIDCNFEGAFALYLDGLRELIEQLLIDAVVAAALAAGGWIALVIALVVIIGAMLIDYLFFSDNPGDSLLDKHTSLQTFNLSQETAKIIYNNKP